MPPQIFVVVMTVLGVLCLIWSAIAILFPRYSFVGSLSPREQVEEAASNAVEARDPVTWDGLGREEATFTVWEQRRAGVMVGVVGVILLWIALV